MQEAQKYSFDSKSLQYLEVEPAPRRKIAMRWVMLFLASIAAFFFYLWIYTSVLHLELPKTILLKKANAQWSSRIELMDRQLDVYEDALVSIERRDEGVYRSIFGMNGISSQDRNSGFGGINRYNYLAETDRSGALMSEVKRLDRLIKKAYVQSLSYDEVSSVAKRAGNMASCIPAVPPIVPDPDRFRLSSSFGYRADPISGRGARHEGNDFACKPGNPVYATGDGVVENVSFEIFGYGNAILINHGFGYKTRYAHLKFIQVSEGMKVKRGQNIGTVGNSGKSTGSHLHYEVLYRDSPVNPYNFFDLSMPVDEYVSMVKSVDTEINPSYKYPTLKSVKK